MLYDNSFNSVKEELASLGLRQSKVDASLLYTMVNGEFLGALVIYVDDCLHFGNALIDDKILKPLTKRFTAASHENTNFEYIGFHLKQTRKDNTLCHDTYVSNLQSIRIEASRARDQKRLPTPRDQQQL